MWHCFLEELGSVNYTNVACLPYADNIEILYWNYLDEVGKIKEKPKKSLKVHLRLKIIQWWIWVGEKVIMTQLNLDILPLILEAGRYEWSN